MPRHPPIALTSRLRIHTTIDRPACMTASIYRRFGLNSDRYKTPGRARDPAGLGALWISQLDNHCCNCRSTCVDRQPRHRFLEPIHNVKDGASRSYRGEPRIRFLHSWKVFAATAAKAAKWWSQPGSNRRPQACKASALPTELWPQHSVRMFTNVRTDEQVPCHRWWAE